MCAVIDLTSGNGNLKRMPEKVYGIAGNWMKSEIIGGFFLCNKAMKEMQALKFYMIKNPISLPKDWITVLVVSHCVSNVNFRRDLAAFAKDKGYNPQSIMDVTDRQLERALRGSLNGQDFRME